MNIKQSIQSNQKLMSFFEKVYKNYHRKRKFKSQRFNLQVAYCTFIAVPILMIILNFWCDDIDLFPRILIWIFPIWYDGLGIPLYLHLKRMITYINIDGDIATFYDVKGKEHVVSFQEIHRIVLTTNRWVFEFSDHKKLYAERRFMWPYVCKDGVEHKGVLRTDFVGVRFDEDYSGLDLMIK